MLRGEMAAGRGLLRIVLRSRKACTGVGSGFVDEGRARRRRRRRRSLRGNSIGRRKGGWVGGVEEGRRQGLF
jgi:hypothetical protein